MCSKPSLRNLAQSTALLPDNQTYPPWSCQVLLYLYRVYLFYRATDGRGFEKHRRHSGRAQQDLGETAGHHGPSLMEIQQRPYKYKLIIPTSYRTCFQPGPDRLVNTTARHNSKTASARKNH